MPKRKFGGAHADFAAYDDGRMPAQSSAAQYNEAMGHVPDKRRRPNSGASHHVFAPPSAAAARPAAAPASSLDRMEAHLASLTSQGGQHQRFGHGAGGAGAGGAGGAGGGGGAGGAEWYAAAPKQWMMNAFQNNQWGVPKLQLSRGRRPGDAMHTITVDMPFSGSGGGSEPIVGHGRTKKEAENAAALATCRSLAARGLMNRQVSSKQVGKKNKGSKGKKKGAKAERAAQAALVQVDASAPPFVLPFAAPVFNGAHVAKKKETLMNNGLVPHLAIEAQGGGLEALRAALSSRWVGAAVRRF